MRALLPERSRVLGIVVSATVVLGMFATGLVLVARGFDHPRREARRLQPEVAAEPAIPFDGSVIEAVPAETITSSTSPPPSRPVTTRGTRRPRGTVTTSTSEPKPDRTHLQRALDAARQRWSTSKPANGYVWVYRQGCFCRSPATREVEVDGAGNVIAVRSAEPTPTTTTTSLSVFRTTSTTVAQQNLWGMSVDMAFDRLQKTINGSDGRVEATFDANIGYATLLSWESWPRDTADGQYHMRAISFRSR